MASLPSYQEATARLDWLDLVAPYIRFADYRSLCLVSQRFWRAFAPRLWRDPLTAARLSGLDPADDVDWWFDFIFSRLDGIRPAFRALVRVLDARGFAKDAYHFSSDQSEKTLQQSFRRAINLLGSVDSILLDGHEDLDPSLLVGPKAQTTAELKPLLLSIAHCPSQLPNDFFTSPALQNLVYLDLSFIPGSIAPLVQPGFLPDVRVLKVRGREIDDATLSALAHAFRLRLWSLDISQNRVTDRAIDALTGKCFPCTSLRSRAHFPVEGQLSPSNSGDAERYGPFLMIEESEDSGTFDHPERYFVDTPAYAVEQVYDRSDSYTVRSGGGTSIRDDSADAAVQTLSSANEYLSLEAFRSSRGLTHLHLSNNDIPAAGIEKLIRMSNGQIESFSCDLMPFLPRKGAHLAAWPTSSRLYGILGAAHIFRPVFSSNLRVLRIHHSLVTNIPSLKMEGLSTLACSYLSETSILSRVEKMYAQTFTPDMNPRLRSLTLTGIPRRSSGPVTEKLVNFLRLLSTQERSIKEASATSSSRRSPGMLQGLRHLRLEFEPDSMEEGFSTSEELDAEGLLNSGDRGFSFFEDEKPERLTPKSKNKFEQRQTRWSSSSLHQSAQDNDGEIVSYECCWNDEPLSIPVWIGSKTPGVNSVIDEYRKMVLACGLRDGVGPATPAQTLAGAPAKSYIFHTAWSAAIMPPELQVPATTRLVGMRDVLDELKRYRLHARAKLSELKQNSERPVPLGEPHYFWTGKLEVSTEQMMPHARPSQYWR